MTWLNRQLLTVLAAVALPLTLVAAFLFYTTMTAKHVELEQLSRDRTEQVAALLNETLQGDLRLATTLASATSITHDEIPAAFARAQQYRAVSPMWRTVRLSDARVGMELFDLQRGIARREISPSIQAFIRSGAAKAQIGGIEPDRDGGYAIYLNVPVRHGPQLRYVLTVVLDPNAIQQLVVRHFPPESVAAVVDPSGRFIARNVDYPRRQGQLASAYVRMAIKGPPQGTYRGVTLEGLQNYTAYASIPLTHWTTHVAIDSTLIDGPRQWSLAAWAGVVALSLTLWASLIVTGLRDHAQRRADEERSRQAQKMEAVGHLTGGIAHDFNNLLTAIIGGLDLTLRRIDPAEPSRRYIEVSLEAARRGVALTSKLLAFSRVQKLQSAPVDLNALIPGMRPLLEQSLGPTVSLHVAVAPDAAGVETDGNQLELALLNIGRNARDAMPEGGDFRIVTRVAPARPGRTGAWVEIALTDTGIGMSKEVAQRAQEPFFTTKAVDRGTGLGLSQVNALARQSGGDVSIESVLGQGTTIRMELPAAKLAMGSPSIDKRVKPHLASPDEIKLLVVDDDAAVRQIMVESLREGGYTVFEALSGEAALARLTEIAPDLLITDFLMPGLNGAEVAARARLLRPDQKIVIVSGHMDSKAIGDLAPDVPILMKPFDAIDLRAKVADILDRR